MRRWVALVVSTIFMASFFAAAASAAESDISPERGVPAVRMITMTAPEEFPDLKGVKIRVPAGTQLAPADELWSFLREAERDRQLVSSGYMVQPEDWRWAIHKHNNWYQELATPWTTHSPWVMGTSFSNETSTTQSHQFIATGSVTGSFTGSVSAKQIVSASFNISGSVSLTYGTTLNVPPGRKLTLWVAAYLKNHLGKMHYEVWTWGLNGWTLSEDTHESVSFTEAQSPTHDVTETCATCSDKYPSW